MGFWISDRPEPIMNNKFDVYIQGIEMAFSKVSGFEHAVETQCIIEGGNNSSPRVLFKPVENATTLTFERGIAYRGFSSCILPILFRVGKRLNFDIVVMVRDNNDKVQKVMLMTNPIVLNWKCSDLIAAEKNPLIETFTISVASVHDLPIQEFRGLFGI